MAITSRQTGTTTMQGTIQRSKNINLSIQERETLFSDCKVNADLNIFSKVNKKSAIGLYAPELSDTDNNTLETLLYLSSNALEQCHQPGFMSAELAKKQGLYIAALKPMVLNRQKHRCYEVFDRDRPIDHIVLTKPDSSMIPGRLPSKYCRVDIDEPDKLRIDCRNALLHIQDNKPGKFSFVIFGLEKGDNGVWHFHAVTQGYLKPHRAALKRTGWGYIKLPDDRREYLEINDSVTQHVTGFDTTVNYFLTSPHPHKKAYLKGNV